VQRYCMGRARKRHVQTELGLRKRDKNGQLRGGTRPGAGRKPNGKRASEPHKARPELKPRFPVHVVLRVAEDIGSLRKRDMYAALREASVVVALRELNNIEDGAFRIVHISIQRMHVHMLVEADHHRALSNGMQRFQISAAKHLNRAATPKGRRRRRGTVFTDRFHEEIIETPRQARHALSYVLNNWRKHREDRGERSRTWKLDPFATGVLFEGWKERDDAGVMWGWRAAYDPMVVYLPKTWLLREGWRRYGLISCQEVPSANARRAGAATRVCVTTRGDERQLRSGS
jgi:putative transposase